MWVWPISYTDPLLMICTIILGLLSRLLPLWGGPSYTADVYSPNLYFYNFDNRLNNWTENLERGSGLGLFLIGSSPSKLLCYAYVNFICSLPIYHVCAPLPTLSAFFFFFSHTNPPSFHLYTSFPTLSIPIGFLPISVHLFQLSPPSFFLFPCRSIFLSSVTIRHPGNSPILYMKTILFSSAMLTGQVIPEVLCLHYSFRSTSFHQRDWFVAETKTIMVLPTQTITENCGFTYADDYGELWGCLRMWFRRIVGLPTQMITEDLVPDWSNGIRGLPDHLWVWLREWVRSKVLLRQTICGLAYWKSSNHTTQMITDSCGFSHADDFGEFWVCPRRWLQRIWYQSDQKGFRRGLSDHLWVWLCRWGRSKVLLRLTICCLAYTDNYGARSYSVTPFVGLPTQIITEQGLGPSDRLWACLRRWLWSKVLPRLTICGLAYADDYGARAV